MRVELIYHPGCDLYKSVHKVLEDVIAEERLPIPVEMVEDNVHFNSPCIRIDGHIIMKVKDNHTFDHFRKFLYEKWAEITQPKKGRRDLSS
jgi:hypothetical protein